MCSYDFKDPSQRCNDKNFSSIGAGAFNPVKDNLHCWVTMAPLIWENSIYWEQVQLPHYSLTMFTSRYVIFIGIITHCFGMGTFRSRHFCA